MPSIKRRAVRLKPRTSKVTPPGPLWASTLAVRGKAGIANARLAYERFEKVIAGDRWQSLATAGARTQRPLWASTFAGVMPDG